MLAKLPKLLATPDVVGLDARLAVLLSGKDPSDFGLGNPEVLGDHPCVVGHGLALHDGARGDAELTRLSHRARSAQKSAILSKALGISNECRPRARHASAHQP